jgi:DNA (cytosine-5)-methyltransferase 1
MAYPFDFTQSDAGPPIGAVLPEGFDLTKEIVYPWEIVVDSFCGGGGASEGIKMAIGRDPDVGINHDEEAVCMHQANHPNTKHYCKSIYRVDPEDVVREFKRPIGLAWFSPDCTHHSKARGGKPKEKHIRDLAWVVVHWAERAVWDGKRPRLICVENVEEFLDWTDLLPNGQPNPKTKGSEFKRWFNAMKKLGYSGRFDELRAHDYGTPTIRKRLFIVFRWDGHKPGWPEPSHGPKQAQPYRTAAECINWSYLGNSIFISKEEGKKVRAKRPLAAATMRRVAHGIDRYVVKAKKPFIVNLTHHGAERVEPLDEPFKTITGANRGEKALIAPVLAGAGGPIYAGKPRSPDAPLNTVTKENHTAIISPVLAGCGGRMGQSDPRPVDKPYHTTTSKADTILVSACLTEHANASNPRSWAADEPLRTQCAEIKGGHFALCGASLVQMGYGENEGQAPRSLDPEKPLGTIVAGGKKHAIAAAHLQRHFGSSIGQDVNEPKSTVMAKGKDSLIAAHLAQHNNHRDGEPNKGRSADEPFSTITASGSQQGVIASSLVKLRGTCADGQPVDEPCATISAQGQHLAHSAAFLTEYYGNEKDGMGVNEPIHTVTSQDRFGLCQAEIAPEPMTEEQLARARAVADLMREHGLWDDREFVFVILGENTYIIADIYMRMLMKRELFNANGFRPDYIIDPIFNGKKMTNTAAVRMAGNAVCPQPACALILANPIRMVPQVRRAA